MAASCLNMLLQVVSSLDIGVDSLLDEVRPVTLGEGVPPLDVVASPPLDLAAAPPLDLLVSPPSYLDTDPPLEMRPPPRYWSGPRIPWRDAVGWCLVWNKGGGRVRQSWGGTGRW